MSRNEPLDDDPYVVIEKKGGSIAPFLVGLAVGAGLALLFAPQSGAETRRYIRRRARRAAEHLRIHRRGPRRQRARQGGPREAPRRGRDRPRP